MNEVIITKTLSWGDFKSVIHKLINGADYDYYVWRGQSDTRWEIESSWRRETSDESLEDYLTRLPEIMDIISTVTSRKWDIIRKIEDSYIEEKVANFSSRQFIKKDEYFVYDLENLFSFLAFLQHHGFPTPLIDCTDSPYIAAFFAFSGTLPSKQPVAIYQINRVKLDLYKTSLGKQGNQWPVIVKAKAQGNQKQIIQQGTYLTASEKELCSIDFKELINEPVIIKYVIASESRTDVMRELNLMGINHMSLFPDINGVCNALKEKYFLSKAPDFGEKLAKHFS